MNTRIRTSSDSLTCDVSAARFRLRFPPGGTQPEAWRRAPTVGHPCLSSVGCALALDQQWRGLCAGCRFPQLRPNGRFWLDPSRSLQLGSTAASLHRSVPDESLTQAESFQICFPDYLESGRVGEERVAVSPLVKRLNSQALVSPDPAQSATPGARPLREEQPTKTIDRHEVILKFSLSDRVQIAGEERRRILLNEGSQPHQHGVISRNCTMSVHRCAHRRCGEHILSQSH
jgi:hypothetical protein